MPQSYKRINELTVALEDLQISQPPEAITTRTNNDERTRERRPSLPGIERYNKANSKGMLMAALRGYSSPIPERRVVSNPILSSAHRSSTPKLQ